MGRFQLESIYRPVVNVVIATKGLQDRNINIIAGTTVENKGKLILTWNESTGSSQRENKSKHTGVTSGITSVVRQSPRSKIRSRLHWKYSPQSEKKLSRNSKFA